MTKSLCSAPTTRTGDFLFKVSKMNGRVMVVAYSSVFQFSHVRYFDSENSAKTFVEYIVMQAEQGKKSETKDT